MERTPQTFREPNPRIPEGSVSRDIETNQDLEGVREKYEMELNKMSRKEPFDEVWVATYLDTLDRMIMSSEGWASESVLREAAERRALLIDGLVKAGFLREEGDPVVDSESPLLH